MPWFYNSLSGELTHADGIEEIAYEAALHTGTGWHELHIADSATEAQAAADALKEVPGGATPTTSILGGAAAGAANVASKAASAATGGITGFLGDLGQRNLWLRAVKVIAGLALIIIGVIQLTHAQAIAGTVVKGAIP